MRGYKLVKEHPNHVELSHPEDGTFRISKAQLSPSALKKVRALPQHLDEGGQAGGSSFSDDPQQWAEDKVYQAGSWLGDKLSDPSFMPLSKPGQVNGPRPDQSQASPSFLDQLLGGTAYGAEAQDPSGTGTSAGATPRPDYPQAPLDNQHITVNPGESPGGNPNTQAPDLPKTGNQPASGAPGLPQLGAGFGQGFATQMAGINDVAKAQGQGASDMAKAQLDNVAAVKQAYQGHQTNMANIQKENDSLTQAVVNTKIDPNRVWSNMSTGNKIMAGIGILLSGAGANAGQGNMAMNVIQKTIDRDVDAQKADLGKKENLLSMNMRKYGNEQMAYQATQMQLNAVAQGQIAAAAAKMQGGVALGQAKQAIGQLKVQQAQLGQNLSMMQLKAALASGKGGGLENNPYVMNQLFPGQVVNVPGAGLKVANTVDDAKAAKEAQTTASEFKSTLGEMQQFMDAGGFSLPGTDRNAVATSLHDRAVAQLNHLAGLSRLSAEDIKLLEGQIPDPGSIRQGKAKAMLDELGKHVDSQLDAVYSQRLINHNPGAARAKVQRIQ